MNMTRIIDIKERIATSDAFKPDERDFILDCISTSVAVAMAEAMDRDRHAVAYFPNNYLGRVEGIWVALSVDEGGEGMCAAPFGGQMLPLIAADARRIEQIKPVAMRIAQMSGKVVRLAKFSTREDVEIYRP